MVDLEDEQTDWVQDNCQNNTTVFSEADSQPTSFASTWYSTASQTLKLTGDAGDWP